jgi:hypothetical protein
MMGNWGMHSGWMGFFWILIIILVIFGIAALVKYLIK